MTEKQQGTQGVQTGTAQTIHAKLMKVRTELRSGKEARNNFGGYDYRNAETMLSRIKPVMEKYGLTLDFNDDIVQIGTRYYVKTTVTAYDTQTGETHSTNQFAREADSKKGMDEAQITGASMTYCHKYALMGLLAISDPKLDPDSMDNTAQTVQAQRPQTPAPAPTPQNMQAQGGYNGGQFNNGGQYGGYYRQQAAY